MAILPSVLHGLATYAGFLDGLITRLLESQMRRYGAALQKSRQNPKPRDRRLAAPPARRA